MDHLLFKLCALLLFIFVNVKSSQGISALENGTILFDKPSQSSSGESSNLNTEFDAEGLGPWYDLANSFISTVLSKEPYDIIKKVKQGAISGPTDDAIIDYAIGMAITVCIGILFCVIMPIVGCCFCCCRCCGNCGGEMTQKDDPRSGCKRAVFGVILCIITLLMFAGVLLTFVCNDNMSNTLDKTKSTSSGIVDETSQFINTTVNEFDSIINKDFKFVSGELRKDISDPGIQRLLGDKFLALIDSTIAEPIRSVKALSLNSNRMRTQLEIIVNNTKDLQTKGQQLATGLDKARADIGKMLKDCQNISSPSSSPCSDIDDSQLQQGANFSKVPDVESELKNIKEVTDQDFVAAAEEGLKVITELPQTIINETSSARSEIDKMIANATKSVNDFLDNLNDQAEDTIMKPLRDMKKTINEGVDLGKQYDQYRWYAGVGLTCLLLLIVVLMALGLMCGICGYNKEATPTTRSTVSNMGGNCLMAATGFCFIFASFLMLLTTICFIIGAPLQGAICKPIQTGGIFDNIIDNPEFWNGTSPFKAIFGNNSDTFKLGEVLKKCRANEPAFKALKIDNFYNITSRLNIRELLGKQVDEKFDELKVNFSDKTILTNSSKQSLKKLNESGVESIDFESFFNETRQGITKVNLTVFAKDLDDLATNLTELATTLPDPQNVTALSVAEQARNISIDLRNLDSNTVQAMSIKSKEMETNVEGLKAIGGNLANDAVRALNAAEVAETKLHNSVNEITDLVKSYTDRVLGYGYQFTDHILDLLKNHLGRCKPLTNIFDAVVVLFCNEMLYPFNGFWLGIGFCLFFFIPSIIFSVKLAKHYRIMKYESDFDDYGHDANMMEMGQPPLYQNVGNDKKSWANPKENGSRR